MSEQPLLNPEQQHDTAQRIMHDAQLLMGGAAIDATGVLKPTDN
jgi:hypothetical protein